MGFFTQRRDLGFVLSRRNRLEKHVAGEQLLDLFVRSKRDIGVTWCILDDRTCRNAGCGGSVLTSFNSPDIPFHFCHGHKFVFDANQKTRRLRKPFDRLQLDRRSIFREIFRKSRLRKQLTPLRGIEQCHSFCFNQDLQEGVAFCFVTLNPNRRDAMQQIRSIETIQESTKLLVPWFRIDLHMDRHIHVVGRNGRSFRRDLQLFKAAEYRKVEQPVLIQTLSIRGGGPCSALSSCRTLRHAGRVRRQTAALPAIQLFTLPCQQDQALVFLADGLLQFFQIFLSSPQWLKESGTDDLAPLPQQDSSHETNQQIFFALLHGQVTSSWRVRHPSWSYRTCQAGRYQRPAQTDSGIPNRGFAESVRVA